MSKPRKAGYTALSRKLFDIAKRPETKLFIKKTKSTDCCAYAEFYEDGKINIHVDSFQTGALPAVIHELLHGILDDYLETLPKLLQEHCIVAVERELLEYIARRPRMVGEWRKLVASKLEDS